MTTKDLIGKAWSQLAAVDLLRPVLQEDVGQLTQVHLNAAFVHRQAALDSLAAALATMGPDAMSACTPAQTAGCTSHRHNDPHAWSDHAPDCEEGGGRLPCGISPIDAQADKERRIETYRCLSGCTFCEPEV